MPAREGIDLARLYLEAGDRARRCGAHAVALRALDAGLAILASLALPSEDPWEIAYPLMFALHRAHAECSHVEGRVDEAERELDLVVERARTEGERAAIDVLRVKLAESRGLRGRAPGRVRGARA